MPMLLHGIALAAWMIVLGGSGPAGAQERVLVSNIGQEDGGVGLGVSPIFILQRWNDHAQKFRTGNNSLGYRLSSVEIQFATFDTGFSYTVTIQQNNGGNPGGTVGTMSNPTASRFTSDRVLKFSAPQGGTLLQPNTDYFVVFTVGAKTGDSTPSVWWRITASDHEDSSGLTGWRIGNEHRLRIRNGSWQANALASTLKLRLNGSVVLDTTAPTVTSIVRQTPSGATTNADELTWRVTFSEAVANVDAADFRITGTTAVLTVTAVTGTSGTTYDVKASGGNLAGLDADVTLGFASAQNIEDTAGNGLSNTTPTGTNHNRYAMDNTAPTVAISGVPTTSTGAFTATFTFSEAVTGFAVGDITVANGVASGFAESTGGGIADNTVWTALITPSGRAVTVDVVAGVAQDAAGNGNSAAMQEGSTYTEPRVVVSPATLALAELDPDSGKKSYTVVLDTDPGADVTITVNNGDTSAVDVDTHSSMDSNQNTLIFTAGGDGTGSGAGNGNWGVAQTVTVQALNDGDAANETFNLTHSASAASGPYKGIRIDPVMVVMIDAGHGVMMSESMLSVAENGGMDTYTMALNSQPTALVRITVASGTTAATVSPATLTFTTANWNRTQTATVTGIDDNVDQSGNRSATITHNATSNDPNYNNISIPDATAIVVDNDNAGVTINEPDDSTSVDEAPGAGRTDSYTVVLDSQPTADVSIAVVSGTTTVATVSPATLTFTTTNWNRTQTVTVTGVDDNVDQSGNRNATITHNATSTDPDYNGIAIHHVTVTLVDNDMSDVAITESDGSTSVTEAAGVGRTDSYMVALTSQPTANVRFVAAIPDGAAATVSPTALTFTSSNWNMAQTVTVTGVDDRVDQTGSRSATITHSTLSTDPKYNGLIIPSLTVTVEDNDTSELVVTEFGTPPDTSVTEESGAGNTDTYTVKLASQPSASVSIAITSSRTTVATVSPSSLTFSTSNWNTAQTVAVTGVDDRVDQTGNRNATITHTATSTDSKYNSLSTNVIVTLVDNDMAGATIIQSSGSTSVNEASGPNRTDTYMAVLDTLPSASVEITVASDATGIATVSPATLTFTTSDWNTGQTVTVTGVDDHVDQSGNRRATITHTATSGDPKYNGVNIDDVTVTLLDDDTAAITINDSGGVSVNEAAGAGRTDPYTVKLATLPSSTVVVTVASGDTGAATVSPATLTFTTTNWNTAQTVTVTGVDDRVDQDGDRSITITHTATSSDPNYNTIDIDNVIAMVVDNDTAAVNVSQSGDSTSVNEASGAGRIDTYTVVLASQPTADVSIAVASGTTAVATVSPATLTFTTTNWNTAQTVTVTGVDDRVDQDGDRSATITHTATSSDPNYNTIDIDNVIAMVVDNDTAAVNVSQSGGSTSVNEASGAGRTDTYTVVLASQPTADVSIAVASGTTAVATVSPATLTFTTTNWNTAQTVTVTGVDDKVDQDGDRSVTITHTATSSDPNYNTIDIDNVIAMVVDNDTAAVNVSQSGGSTSVNEASGAGRIDTYTVVLASQPTVDVSIAVASGTTAVATVSPATLTFSPSNWNTAQTVTVTGVDDRVDQDGNRSATITHTATSSDPNYNTIDIDNVIAMVVDNDTAAVNVSQSGGFTSVNEASGAGRTDTYTVVLASQPTADVSIAVVSGTTAAATVSPATLTFSPSNWNTAQTVTVTGVDDRVDQDGNRSATITHTATSSDPNYNTIDIDNVIAMVVDNDTAAVNVSQSDGSTSVNEASGAGRTDTYTVVLASQPTVDVSIAVASGTTAVATVSPATLTFSPSNWNTAQTVTVTGVDDRVDQDGNRRATITHTATSSDPNYNTIDIDNVIAMVVDNDTAAVNVSQSGGSTSVNEASGAGRTDTYTVVLGSQPTADVSIAVASGTTAVATVSPATLTFTTTNWNTMQTVTVTGVDDRVDQDGDRSITITHTATSSDPNYNTIDIDNVIVMVVDNDTAAVNVSHSDGFTSVNEASGAGRTDTYTVVLGTLPTAHVEIEIESGDTGAATVGPTILTFTPSNWNTAQTVTVTGVDDDVDQSNNRRVTISHTATSTDASYNNISIGAITVMVVNDDRTGVTVTPSDGSTFLVTEALGPTNTDTYTVGLATQPTASVSIAVTSDRTEAATVRPATLTFTPFNWNTAQTVTVTGVDDGVDQRGDRSATISHTAISSDPKYNTIDIDDVTATVVDNDTEVSITGDAAVITEGEEASFTVTTTPPPPAGITISVNVIISDSGSFVSSGQTGNRVVTINEGGTATITVATEDDITPETDGRITATVGTGNGYRPHGNNGSASTTVEDNFDDAPALAPSTEMLTVTEGGAASYTIALDSQPMDDVTVTISVSSEEGVVPTPNFTSPGRSPLGGSNAMDGGAAISVYPTTLTFTPSNWDTAQRVTITLSENSDAVGAAITLTHTTSRGGHQGFTAHVLVMVEADDPVEKTAWHLRFGRTVSHQVVAALQERLTAPPTPGLQLTVAGEPVTNAPPLAEHEGLLSKILGFEAVTGEALVESSSLGFTPESEGAGPQLAFWGQGSLSSFSGKEEDLSLAGDITTLLLGADWTGQRWRAGAALTHSWGRGSYGGEGDNADGEINSILTGVFPYGRYALTPRLGIWSAAGYGWGQLSFQSDGEDEFTPSTTMAMTAAGLDGVLLDGGSEGITLISTADVLTLKAASATVDRLPSSEGTISRVRVGLEAARPFPLSHGASLLPSMEMGIRQDGGDAEAGYGLDLGAGIVWSDPERGISGEMKGRTLLIHAEEEFQEQGLALSFSWDPSPFNRGPSLSLSHTMGATPSGGMDALLNPTTMEGLDVTPSTGQQFEAELTYGFPAHNDRLTLTSAVALAFSPISRNYSLLWSLTSYSEQVQADPWQLSLTGERQEQKASMSPVEHSLKLIFSTLF